MIEISHPDRQTLYLVLEESLDVGRECDGLLLGDPEVSRRHARLRSGGGRLTVEDLGSRNGTTVDGSTVDGPTEVRLGQTVRLGSTEIRLSGTGADEGDVVRHTAQLGTGGERGTVAAGTQSGGPTTVAAPAPPPDERVVRAEGGNDEARMTSIEVVARSVDTSRAGLSDLRGGADTVTIVFSDIESSTEHAMRLGDQRWFEVLGIHNDIVRRTLAAFGGTEIKSQGDGFMLTFPSARKASQFCMSVQQDLDVHARRSPDEAVRIRIGLHTGEAIVDDEGDLFGKHIIVAARIANLAEGGQILASGVVKEIASSRGDIEFGPAELVDLKGIEGPYPVHEVVWQD